MKVGYFYNKHTGETEDNFDLIWVLGTVGNQRNPDAEGNWEDLDGWKRGIVMQPRKSAGVGVNENASKLQELLNDLGYSDWNNGVPIIVDMYSLPEADPNRFNINNLIDLGIYIQANFNAQLKPLLRIQPVKWEAWYRDNPALCGYLLLRYDILLVHFGVTKPATISGYGLPAYWEHAEGYYRNDPTRLWTTDPVAPPVVPPVTPPEPPVIPPPATGTRFVVKMNGVVIPGLTIEPL